MSSSDTAKNLFSRMAFQEPDLLSFPPSWLGHIPFAFWLTEALRPRVFVELGTHSGNSYCAFCQAVKQLDLPTSCFAIDTWKGDAHSGYYDEAVFRELSAYHDSRYGSFSRMVRSTFDEALGYFPDCSVDLLHIDGFHSYEVVKHDFESWLPKLSANAIVLLHDINVRERDFGVWRYWEELSKQYPSFRFLHSHGLGVLAVGTELPDRVRWLVGLNGQQEDERVAGIRAFFGRLGQILIERNELRRLEAELAAQNGRIRSHLEEIGRLNGEISNLGGDLAKLGGELVERQTQIAKLGSEIEQRDARIGQFSIQVEQHGAEFGRLNGEVARLSGEIAEREREIARLGDELARLGADLTERKVRVAELGNEVGQRDARIAQFTDQVEQLTTESGRLKVEIVRSGAEVAAREGEIARLKGDGIFHNAEIQRLNDELARVAGEVSLRDEEIARIGGEIERREVEIARLGGEVGARDAEIARLGSEVGARDTEIARLGSEVGARDTEIARLGGVMGARDAEIARLGGEMGARDVEIGRLGSEMGARDTEIARLGGEVGARDVEIGRLGSEMGARDVEIARLCSEMGARDAEIARLGSEVGARDAEIARLGSEVGARDEENARVQRNLAQLTAELHRSEVASGELEARLDQQQMLLHRTQRDLAAKIATLAEAEEEVQDTHRLLEVREAARAASEKELQHSRELAAAADTSLAQREEELRHARDQAATRELALSRAEVELAARDRAIASLAAERATIGAAIGRWITRQRRRLAPTGTRRAALLRLLVLAFRGVRAEGVITRIVRRARYDGRRVFRRSEKNGSASPANRPEDAEPQTPQERQASNGAAESARQHIVASGLFDADYYLSQYPDIADAGVEPLAHYIEQGAAEGRNPHPLFHTSYYLRQHPNVEATGMNALVHYLLRGAKEGYNPNAMFDSTYYLDQYADVRTAGVNPLVHYLRWGAQENRNPHPSFDSADYVRQNPDVRSSGMIPLVHYVTRLKSIAASDDIEIGYPLWTYCYDRLMSADRAAIGARIARMAYRPRFSVVMPVYNTPETWLRRAIESVRTQLYPDWELCIADDASTDPAVREVLRDYSSRDSRIHVTYRESNGHIAAASNDALALADGDYIVFMDHDDEIVEHALYMMAEELNQHRDAVILYSDEDKIDENGKRFSPYFKPDWNPDLFYGQNFLNHLTVCQREKVIEAGAFRLGTEGSQDYDLLFRIIERIRPEQIRHIPHVLYHWRAASGSTAKAGDAKNYALVAARRAIREHLERSGTVVEVTAAPRMHVFHRAIFPLPEPPPLVSLIIPTRDQAALLGTCVDGILTRTEYPRVEVIIIDNGSVEPESFKYFERITRDPRVRVVRDDLPFNFAALNNRGAQLATGSVLGLLNNDLEIIEPDWLSEMVRQAVRPDIGAVGALLYYPNDTIQHAGVVLGIGGVAGHLHKRISREDPGYFGRAMLAQNLSAVTAGCLVIRKAVYDEVNGMDERLAVAFNDVDFCIRILERGYRNLFTPYARLIHHESLSRGYEDTPEKVARFQKEFAKIQKRWNDRLLADPAFNPNLSLASEIPALAFPPRVRKPWHTDPALNRAEADLAARERAVASLVADRSIASLAAERAAIGTEIGCWITRQRRRLAPTGTRRAALLRLLVLAFRVVRAEGVITRIVRRARYDARRVFRRRKKNAMASPANRPEDAELQTPQERQVSNGPVESARQHIVASGLFDAGYYLSQYPDVADAGVEPLTHYLEHGAAQGRNPHPLFHTSYYLKNNPDVARSGVNPLAHFILSGAADGLDPSPLFDTSYYLEKYADVALAGINPLAHYMCWGASEGRSTRNEALLPTDATSYRTWVDICDQLTPADRQGIAEHMQEFQWQPRISVLIPVYNTPEKWLRAAITSVRHQLYPHWELCIADDHSDAAHVREVLAEAQAADPRIKVVHRTTNGGISEATNSALEMATGDFLAFLDHDDELREHALYMLAVELNAHPEADLIYSDEDKIDQDGRRCDPYFKPDWDPDLILAENYVCHLTAMRTALVRQVGGLRRKFDGSQDHDLVLRISEVTLPDRIRHIPHVLYHWRIIPGSTAMDSSEKPAAGERARAAIRQHLERRGIRADVTTGVIPQRTRVVYDLPEPLPLVSAVIPTKDNTHLLQALVDCLFHRTDYPNLELVIVSNNTQAPAALDYLAKLRQHPRVKLLSYPRPYNFSAINNLGVRHATGEVVALINDDIEGISSDWLKEMVRHALRADVGIVGAKLYYPDGGIQHAGVILGIGGIAGHIYKHAPRGWGGRMGDRAIVTQTLSALTFACVALRREVYQAVGGLDEDIAVVFNDVDFCIRVRNSGYRNVFTPHAELLHKESATRGFDDTPQKRMTFEKETRLMRARWGDTLLNDPYYNPNLSLQSEDEALALPSRAKKPWLQRGHS